MQRGSVVVSFVLAIAALIAYGSTVYTQQLWSKQYRELKTLQRKERQMITATGALKQQLIEQAERPEAGLVPRSRQHMVFVQPAPPRSGASETQATGSPSGASDAAPMGY